MRIGRREKQFTRGCEQRYSNALRGWWACVSDAPVLALVSPLETSQAAGVRVPDAKILIGDDPAEPVRFAAVELGRYLTRMTGREVAAGSGDLPVNTLLWGSVAVPCAQQHRQGDAFSVQPIADGAAISGSSPRGVLHGVYALLEQLGCRWSLHGRETEVVPRLSTLPPILPTHSAPRFDVRGYSADIMTWHYNEADHLAEHLAADYEFVDWMAKSAANAFLFIRHPFDSQSVIPELLPECARRGIDVEVGGHVIPLLVPRQLFKQHPDWFPQSASGTRSDLGNLCTANPAAMRVATDNALRYVAEHRESQVLHVWGADLSDGGWCRCVDCAALTPQDQSLRFCNAVANVLAEHGVSRTVCYLAYHDTIDANLRGRPADNVFVEYAARERCYGHALDDVTCSTNRRYREALERYVDLFSGRVRIFEYYADAILFCGCAVPLGEVIAADLDFYHHLGIREITNLQFGSFSLWAYPLNLLAYAAATRAAGCDLGRLRETCLRGPKGTSPVLATTLAQLEAAMRDVVTYGDVGRPPQEPESIRRLLPRLDDAIESLTGLIDSVAPTAGDLAAGSLQALLRYNRTVLFGVQEELLGRAAAGHFETALNIVRAVDRRLTGLWGAVDLPVIHAYYAAARARRRS